MSSSNNHLVRGGCFSLKISTFPYYCASVEVAARSDESTATSSPLASHHAPTATTMNNSKMLIEKIEKLNQKSVGFTQDLELFTNFDNKETIKIIFIYGKR